MVVIQTVCTNVTLLCTHVWKGLFTDCAIVMGAHVEQEILTRSGTPDFTPIWGVHDFTDSLYIHYIICQCWGFDYGIMTGSFA